MSSLLNDKNNLVNLPVIKKNCDANHSHCLNIVRSVEKSNIQISKEYFNDFLNILDSSRYSCCLVSHYNYRSNEIKKFIVSNSVNIKINSKYWGIIFTNLSDNEIYEILTNQVKLEPDLISKIYNNNISYNQRYYQQSTNIINSLMSTSIKLKSFSYIIMSLTLLQFSNYINKIYKNFSPQVDDVIIKFIIKNELELISEHNIGLKIINTFINRSSILKIIYPLISKSLSIEQKQIIFNKSISTLDKNLLILILENRDFIPNMSTIHKLIEKSNCEYNANNIANIIDLLVDYGLVITKEIILKLLSHKCYINNFEKYGIPIDSEILSKCADLSYYPYKFDIIPNIDILKKECSKRDNLKIIQKLKEYGGIYTSECLENACRISRNGKVIKYLMNECGVKITDQCLENFQQTYNIDALDIIMKKYKSPNPIKKQDDDTNKYIELNEKSTMTITPRNIDIDKNNDMVEYKLKNKVRNFFNYKNKNIKYYQLHEIFIKYLINNKLIIGKYFIINIELSNLLKINHCVIMDTNQIHNILTYFIDLLEKNNNTNNKNNI